MVCNPAPPKVTHVPDFFALATCPSCGKVQILSHHDLKSSGRPVDGTAVWPCSHCNQKTNRTHFF